MRFSYTDDPNILTNGNKLETGEAYDVDGVVQTLYARSESATARIELIVEEGIG